MNEVFITAGNILTCAGDLEQTWSALQTGGTSLFPRRLDGFDQAWPLGIIPDLPDEGNGTNTRLEALFDRLFHDLPKIGEETPLLLATTKGAADELLRPDEPFRGQPWQIGSRLCERLSLIGGSTTFSAACASSTIAIIQAALRIASGECEQALVVGIDLIGRFILGGFASLKALSLAGCRPFDKKRDGLSLGEGGGWLLLSKRKESFNNTSRILSLTGWGIACDAIHITAPCRQGTGLISAITQATAGKTETIGGINAHGTGTLYNDAMELTAFNKIWDTPPPLCSVKGGIGHCLGAAGIIEATLSLKSLETECLPPTIGCIEPESDTPMLSEKSSLPLQSASILSCNSGFGGINAAFVFSRIG
jgi:3-oxoacyl-(acyl-carrier-protein) synthase